MSGITLNTIKNVVIIVLFLIAGIGAYFYFNNNAKWNSKYNNEVKFKLALVDTLHQYKDEKGRWVSEKLTLQTSLKEYSDKNLVLTDIQKQLRDEVKTLSKDKDLISAALIKETLKVDSLKNIVSKIDTINNTITFNDSTKDIKYNLMITNAKPFDKTKETDLLINELYFPNFKLIDFSWGDKKTGYPISFSVRNSNIYMQTSNIESYVIPQLQKETVKPSFGQRLKNFFKKTGKDIGIFLVGAVVGGGIVSATK